MNYQIYGHCLQIDTDDEVLINALTKGVGHFVIANVDQIGTIRFVKVNASHLYKHNKDVDGMLITSSYVQPTHEYSTIYRSLSEKRLIHFYDHYYLVEYIYDSSFVKFYYTEEFYKIIDLLGEFIKYYVFEKALSANKFALHSSCIVNKDISKSIIFFGDSGCGKSSNALMAALKRNYEFMNDEVTYIVYQNGNILSIPTSDKFKICAPMFFELKEKASIHFTKNNAEYICDFQSANERSAKAFHTECFVALMRDDRISNIERNSLSKIQLYDILLRNLHFSFCNSKADQKLVLDCASRIIKNCNIISIRYPTKLIRDVIDYI